MNYEFYKRSDLAANPYKVVQVLKINGLTNTWVLLGEKMGALIFVLLSNHSAFFPP